MLQADSLFDEEVEGGAGARHVVLHAEAEAEMLAKEVGILQLTQETELGVPLTVGRAVGHGVHTAADIKTDIVAMLVQLGAGGEAKDQKT